MAAVALLVLAGARVVPLGRLQVGTALLLLAFGLYKIFRFYRNRGAEALLAGIFAEVL